MQKQIAHGVAEAVIDLLEAVDIQHQHRQAIALEDGSGQLLLEQHAIRQPSDGVVVGQALQLGL
ncbi:hypothetical protein D3C76_1675240 [compost metagenome]